MYTNSTITKVHPNGLINYESFLTNSDGSEIGSFKKQLAQLKKEQAEKELAEAEQALIDKIPGAENLLNKAEAKLDDALEDILNSYSDSNDGNLVDDYRESTSSYSSSDEIKPHNRSSFFKKQKTHHKTENIYDRVSTTPNNFSQIILQNKIDFKKFPLFNKARPIFCEITAGDILYLPAGWFHNVTSYNYPSLQVTKKNDIQNGHLALNYWVHPPNHNDYEQPYLTHYWLNHWNSKKNPIY